MISAKPVTGYSDADVRINRIHLHQFTTQKLSLSHQQGLFQMNKLANLTLCKLNHGQSIVHTASFNAGLRPCSN